MHAVQNAMQHLVVSFFTADKHNISLVHVVCLVMFTHIHVLPCC